MRTTFSLVVAVVTLATAAVAEAHYKPGSHNALHAIAKTWCGKDKLVYVPGSGLMPPCYTGKQAARVARCEASARYWYTRPQEAKNGQYLGMFQMGHWARGRYGHGPSVWHQARAAYKNWRENGWQNQWECAQILGIW